MSNALQDYKGAADIGITPDDSPTMDEMLQGVTPLTEVAPQPQGLQLKTTGGDTLIEQIELFLRARWIFRYNVVSNKAEFKLVKDPDAPFVEMRDFDYNSILRDLKYADLQCSMSTLRMILASKFMVEYDPYIEYTVNLPEYDGQTDYIEQLADTVATGNQVFWRRAFKKWFVAMAASWMQPEVVNHTALIMSGEQGIGKTTWLGNLIPTPLRKYVYAGMVNVRDKDKPFAGLDKAYAQAINLIQNGFQYWFSQDELSELEQNNEEFRAVIPEEEQLMAFYEPCTEDDTDAVFMLNTEILKNLLRLSGLRTLSDQKLGRVLKARKFIRIKRQGRYGYLIKTKTQEVPTT